MSRILTFGVLDWVALMADRIRDRHLPNDPVPFHGSYIVFLSTGVISAGRGMLVKSGKLSTEMLGALMLVPALRNRLRRL
jgi:hypothetical protein